MFDATLLESSPAPEPVLTRGHWLAALAVGALGSLAGYALLPFLFTTRLQARWVESILLGFGVMFYELMVWYVLADARRLGLNAPKWSIVLLVLNVFGFVAYLIYAAAKTGEWKRAAMPIAYMVQGIILVCLLMLPLARIEALPDARLTLIPRPPARSSAASHPSPRTKASRHFNSAAITFYPVVVPKKIAWLQEKPEASLPTAPAPGVLPESGPGGSGGPGVPFGLPWDESTAPPPGNAKQASEPSRIRVGEPVEEAKLIFHPDPIYPPLAILSRIQGKVVLEAIIGKDGTIQNLRAISGHPLLVPSALEAVARWRYQPTLLDGVPVEVATEIQVNFVLGD